MSGEIRDFRQKAANPKAPTPQILSATTSGQEAQVVKASEKPQEPQVELRIHEEVVREGQDSVRSKGDTGGIEIRMRQSLNPREWDKIKRGDDE
jgi:hypothetical protein